MLLMDDSLIKLLFSGAIICENQFKIRPKHNEWGGLSCYIASENLTTNNLFFYLSSIKALLLLGDNLNITLWGGVKKRLYLNNLLRHVHVPA